MVLNPLNFKQLEADTEQLLQNDKIIELLNYPNKVQIEDYNRTSNWKVLQLEDGAILYFEKRAENVFSAVWYPDLQTFEYYYYNNYAP